MKNGLLAVCSFILGLFSLILLAEYGEPALSPLGIVGDIISFIIFILLLIATSLAIAYFISKQQQIGLDKEYKEKEQRIRELEKKYSNYVAIVHEKSKVFLKQLQQNYPNAKISQEPIGHHYLIMFDNYISSKAEKSDTFTIAACLMYCLTQNKMIVCCNPKEYNKDIEFSLNVANCQLAFAVALQLISEPITFERDSLTGKLVEKKHPQKSIIVPNGIIEENSLYERIVYSLYKNNDDYYRSIMNFSNLLELLYLNSK